jgi:hypothetical protein
MRTYYLFLYSCMLCNGHQFLFVICVRAVLQTRQLTIKDFVLIFSGIKIKKTRIKNMLHVLRYDGKPVMCFLKKISEISLNFSAKLVELACFKGFCLNCPMMISFESKPVAL